MKNKSYFRSSGYISENIIRTDSGFELDLSLLPPFLRTLLVTDGTVTKSLEAWFWETINVESLSNELETVENEINGLDVSIGDQVLKREVNLKGKDTNNIYAYAKSIVSLKHVSDVIANSLKNGEIGIGEILREKDVETYRDIFDINYLSDIESQTQNIPLHNGNIISRSYRIRVNGVPSIIVNEFFPISLYE